MFPQDHPDNWFKGQGHWSHVLETDWSDWRWQMKHRFLRLEHFENYLKLTESEEEGCSYAGKKLYVAVTPYFFNLIDPNNPNCPIRKQVIPRKEEMIVHPEEVLDPVGEEKTMPVKGLVHRYPDRVLFLTTPYCASYCRYCTRSRLVSNASSYNLKPNYEEMFQYIESNPQIRDVLLSGGDPLFLPLNQLKEILFRLKSIRHVEFVRIGTRIPVFLPQKIDEMLCDLLKQCGPIFMSIHVNHPKECTIELKEACEKLLASKVVLGNQSVLLKGVNDDPEILMSLSHRLLQMGVRPYYLYQCDLIAGSSHFRTHPMKGLDIMKKMVGWTSGYAVPKFVIDAPGGGGKIPLQPNFLQEIHKDRLVLSNYQQKPYEYPMSPCEES